MVKKHQQDARKPKVVYDVKMPAYGYRDEKGQSRTIDIVRPKPADLKLDCLANLPIA